MSQIKTTFCRICENQCGLSATIENDQITHIAPDMEHVVSKGYACIKGLTLENFRTSEDRLQHPLKKINGSYERISWQQALSEIGDKVEMLRKTHGDDSMGLYFGNPISFSPLLPLWITGLAKGLKTTKFFNTGSLDCNNKFAVSERMYGAGMALTFPDVDKTQFLMIIGGNPLISKMSFIHLPDPVKRLQGITERGGRVVHINPRNTETAKAVGEHEFIRPDTDVYFLMAFLQEILQRNIVDQSHIAKHMSGFDKLLSAAKDWTPEKQAMVTGISASKVRELVNAYLEADGAALYLSTGVNQGRNGTLAFWVLEVINAITGNLDRRGGTLMGQGIIDYAKMMAGSDISVNHSRIGKTPSLLEALPAALLADEILTPGDGQIKGLLVISGNPLLTATNTEKLARAFERLELMVSVEIVRNETANYADYILPGSHFAERPDIPFTFFSFSGLTPIPWFQYTDRLVNLPGECKDEMWIISQLAKHCNAPLYNSKVMQFVINMGEHFKRIPLLGSRLTPSAERILGLICRFSKQGSLKQLRQHPHGVLRTPLEGNNYLGQRVVTIDGKVNLAPEEFLELAKTRLPEIFTEECEAPNHLKLITKRERFSHNSWAHNDPAYIKGKRNQNYLYMHSNDALQRNISDGEAVRVSSPSGVVSVTVSITNDMMPGSVALPHGWGHQNAEGLTIAKTTGGANANVLASDGPDAIEPISGMAQLTGIVVHVEALNTAE